MGISDTLVGKSDQLDNIDLIAGPRDFTITRVVVKKGGEQPVNIDLAEFPRPWRPGLTMRRLLVAIWGEDETAYVGRRVRLYRDPDVPFGDTRPGGTRISHASHIDGTQRRTLPTGRGKVGTFVVDPLPDAPAKPARKAAEPVDVATMTDRDALRAMWRDASPEIREQITARVAELDATPTLDDETWIGGEPA